MGYNGNSIGKMRRGMRLSRQKLGQALEINQRTLARWESGETEPGRWALLAVTYLQLMDVDARKAWIATGAPKKNGE